MLRENRSAGNEVNTSVLPVLTSCCLFLVSLISLPSQPVWSWAPLPPPPPSCTQTPSWTVMTGRGRNAGISCGPRMALWGTVRAPPGARSKEKSCYSKRGGGSSLLPSHTPPPAVTHPCSSLSVLLFFNIKTSHFSSTKTDCVTTGSERRENRLKTPVHWNFPAPPLSQYGG